MGGRAQLENVRNLRLDEMGHTALMEQSYRQDPFITSYEHIKETIDFEHGHVHRETHGNWPESDPGQSSFDLTLIAAAAGGVYHTAHGDNPCSLADLDSVRQGLALGPARVLLTALGAPDLHLGEPEMIRATTHASLAFTWQGMPVRILINPFNHLPDAVETVRTFHDFWYFWGDVRQRIYFENWEVFNGLVYPTNAVDERNGAVWRSTQILNFEINVAADDALFHMDTAASAKSTQGKGWDRPFQATHATDLAPGITLFEGAWNSTIIKGDDSVYILEAPISGTYSQGVIDEAKKRYPDVPITGVLSTSDSWPHTGGVRQSVALGLPVFILDLNQPILDRIVAAPHTMQPDPLAQAPKKADWRVVSQKVVVGTGANRAELYPIRGASTERQYMVYFPEHYLLYASDTLVLNDNGSLYDPRADARSVGGRDARAYQRHHRLRHASGPGAVETGGNPGPRCDGFGRAAKLSYTCEGRDRGGPPLPTSLQSLCCGALCFLVGAFDCSGYEPVECMSGVFVAAGERYAELLNVDLLLGILDA
jgi:hypothetical protein